LLPEPKPQRPAQPDDMLGLRDLFKEGMGDSPASCAADIDDFLILPANGCRYTRGWFS
jgi:hypothetical protein